MLDLDDLVVFAEVADAGGLTRAGRKLGLSKSILSRRLSRLEETLGAALFVRTTRGVLLTEEGANFKPFAERMIAEMAAARAAMTKKDEPTGTLRIAAPLSFGQSHLAPLLAELGLRHPQLRIHAFYSDRLIDLISERSDVGIRIGAMPDSSLLATRIAPIRAGVVATPAYIARHGLPETLDDIARHNTLVHVDHPWRGLGRADGCSSTWTPPVLYRHGGASYLQVLISQNSNFSAELNLAQAQLNERLALIQLYNALGGGWQ